jgi:type VI protein secretion system component VasK
MKNKYLIAIILFGVIITIFGALIKIMQFQFGIITGSLLLSIGMLAEVLGIILLIIKLTTNKKDNFLNK